MQSGPLLPAAATAAAGNSVPEAGSLDPRGAFPAPEVMQAITSGLVGRASGPRRTAVESRMATWLDGASVQHAHIGGDLTCPRRQSSDKMHAPQELHPM